MSKSPLKCHLDENDAVVTGEPNCNLTPAQKFYARQNMGAVATVNGNAPDASGSVTVGNSVFAGDKVTVGDLVLNSGSALPQTYTIGGVTYSAASAPTAVFGVVASFTAGTSLVVAAPTGAITYSVAAAEEE